MKTIELRSLRNKKVIVFLNSINYIIERDLETSIINFGKENIVVVNYNYELLIDKINSELN
ncbi:hypothetical protein BTO04_02150 [Polaribacter sp. SA4-10]|jgi:hypothetical protein|uniref:hypothetical protein n=1 Tax=Polaribacter sp. SA4-10 TaxID=754397 RepID=UPI000B3D3D45|nr:hypothetical protein [Polaribacter sp. SA4-10]ARV05571.1 hypothetical protein BTO04_02150 [Polaribacter sp. SA4-10]